MLLCILVACSCNRKMFTPMYNSKPRIAEETNYTKILKSLPPANEKLYVAVYKFRDQTGQYRPSEVGASWSTAVTQGGTNILLKALEDSRFFTVVERENISNLLNERKIIRNSRAQYGETDNSSLPPLLFAGMILEGGIVSYDANVITGGAGARYFGAGGSVQYRQDRVSVFLRAISTQNGKIIKTVNTSKTILSQALDGGLFRFVSFQRLLEAETGYTYNEPSELAVTEAIEKAVYSLIMEGVEEGLWNLSSDSTSQMKYLTQYRNDVTEDSLTNFLGKRESYKRKGSKIGLNYTFSKYNGDLSNPQWASGFNLFSDVRVNDQWSIQADIGSNRFKANLELDQLLNYFNLSAKYHFTPFQRVDYFASVGIGSAHQSSIAFRFDGGSSIQFSAGLGADYELKNGIGINLHARYFRLSDDTLDNIVWGQYNDMYFLLDAGIRYNF